MCEQRVCVCVCACACAVMYKASFSLSRTGRRARLHWPVSAQGRPLDGVRMRLLRSPWPPPRTPSPADTVYFTFSLGGRCLRLFSFVHLALAGRTFVFSLFLPFCLYEVLQSCTHAHVWWRVYWCVCTCAGARVYVSGNVDVNVVVHLLLSACVRAWWPSSSVAFSVPACAVHTPTASAVSRPPLQRTISSAPA